MFPKRTDPESGNQVDARSPFTREIAVWRTPRPLKTDYQLKPQRRNNAFLDTKPSHYKPRGERSDWTQAQYTVYKEEKTFFRARQWTKRKPELRAIAKELSDQQERAKCSVEHDYRHRYVLGRVPARLDGQPAIERDERGIPLTTKPEPESAEADPKVPQTKMKSGEPTGGEGAVMPQKRKVDEVTDDEAASTPRAKPSTKRAKK